MIQVLNSIFEYSNYAAMVGWLLLIAAPRWKWTAILVISGLLPFVWGLLYVILILTAGQTTGGYGSLGQVYELFGNRHALLAGWIHFLGFDLFIGSWQVRQATKHNIKHWFVIPGLFLTFWFGPVGYAWFFILRIIKTKTLINENF